MSSPLLEKEKELEVSRLENAILEKEVKILRKQDEIKRLDNELTNARKKLAEKRGN